MNHNKEMNLNYSMTEISKILENFKDNRDNIEKDIAKEEDYKENLYEKFRSYQNELERIQGINSNFIFNEFRFITR